MGKSAPFVTGNLYRIGDKIAETQRREQKQDQAAPPEKPAVPLSPEQRLEFQRLKHDLEIRTETMLSRYQAEADQISRRSAELLSALEQVKKLRETLDSSSLPAEDADTAKNLSKILRSFELMRLETIRIEGKTEESSTDSNPQNRTSVLDLPGSELIKKGFFFFLPFGLILLFCTILLSFAFIFAWKVAL